ncbi:8-oxoguanine DNA glycosylase OGG fold protein, partial [Streptomyces sp. NPDC004285]
PASAAPAAGRLSRARVTDAVREAVRGGRWTEALAVPYAWGHGGTGYGPHRLRKILAAPHAPRVLAEAASVLGEGGAVEAYRVLRGAVKGLGPAFFTKFLYFVDQAADAPAAPRALVLDRKVARVVRAHAARVGREADLPAAAGTAAWIWSDGGWTEHRYAVYLRWVAHASGQLASAGIGWPEDSPDLLELALFSEVWDPAR